MVQTKRENFFHKAAVAMGIFVLSFAGGWLGGSSRNGQSPISDTNVARQAVATKSGAAVSSIAKSTGQSVVSVNVTSQSASSSSSLYSQLFGYDVAPQEQESAGTGIILTADGLIMTNRHVVPSGTSTVSVTLSDGTEYKNVKVIGRTSSSDSLDIAFLKIPDTNGRKLTPANLGDSSKMSVGDQVVAIGNTLGQFQNTVTTGILSGYGRSIQAGDGTGGSSENLDDLFQTDAAINEGNSGGPLVNMSGEVIGINTAIASGAQTVGFAIPINNVKGLIESVEQKGKLERPYLGIRYVLLTDDIAKELSLKVTRGAYIPKTNDQSGIVSGGPADKAGLKEGDVVTKVDGTDINEKTSLISVLGKHKVGDSVKLTVVRDGKTIQLKATLAAAPTS